jgi:uncharacterized protein Yka (UPF0111/DUF47 family)
MRDAKFFDPLRTQMDLLVEGSRLLWEGAKMGGPGMRKCAERIEELRIEVARLYTSMVFDLRKTLITPIDPEDILRLSSSMKRLFDTLARAASRQEFCPCQPAPEELLSKLEIIHQCSLSLKNAFGSFRNGALPRHCEEIHDLSIRASRIARDARDKLFALESGPIAVIRLRETYDLAQVVLSRYVDLSETLKRIKLKNG